MGWLIVEVWKKSSSGQMWPWEYCEVSGALEGFWHSGNIGNFRTDDRGRARVTWSGDCDLDCLYVKGKRINGPFESGGSYPPIIVDW